jgi:hypothetical protein
METNSLQEWQELTRLTQGSKVVIEQVRLVEKDIAIQGRFDLPALARLTIEDQYFVTAFIRTHGSIKEMEQLFGVSYPTIKNRLNRIAEQLDFIEINPAPAPGQILEQLQRGEITFQDAIGLLKK